MRAGSAPTVDIGLPALATLSKDQSLAVCLSCHSLKARLAEQWRPGAPLSRFYAVRLAQLDDRPYTEDGRTRTFAYQEGHLASNCYRNGGMTCVSCHDPHTQHYRTVDGRPIPGRTNDGQCPGCHASKAVDPPAHTMHARNSAGSRCVSCHMPYEQQHELGRAIRYARSDHTIPIPRPVLDSSLGITSSCRTCHAEKTETQHAAQIARWWGALRPHEPAVAGLLAARGIGDGAAITPLLLQPDSRTVTAQVAGLARWLERVAEPDMAVLPADAEARLRALATSSDIDVRALALATLHFVRGNDAGTRRWLIAAITTQPGLSNDDQLGVPQRWAAVLGGVGDAARAANAPARAIIAYRKALEVASGDAALLLNLGLARAASGDVAGAVQSYQHSLRADQSRQSASARATSTVLAQVNLGIAFEQGGESDQAVRAYERAIVVDVTGPLGYLNLGTKRLRDGDAAAAIPMFERALARDPGLAVGHFQLALAYLKQGDRRRAAASVRRAIALDTTNADARQLAAALEEALKSQGR